MIAQSHGFQATPALSHHDIQYAHPAPLTSKLVAFAPRLGDLIRSAFKRVANGLVDLGQICAFHGFVTDEIARRATDIQGAS